MKNKWVIIFILSTLLSATNDKKDNNKSILEKELQKQLEREKKYAREQTFYSEKEYDLESFEVNEESLKALPDIKEDNTGDEMLEMD